MGKNIKKLLIIEIIIWFLNVCFLVPPSLTLLALRVRHCFKCSYSSHLNFHYRENPHQNLTDFDLIREEGNKKLKKIKNNLLKSLFSLPP
ncbi:MAG: hypothetical protein LBQ24_05645 [Candidatus Peribacteria bacterium]|nr:hypothetical protein [Candidatus Peribacteria bacterium]